MSSSSSSMGNNDLQRGSYERRTLNPRCGTGVVQIGSEIMRFGPSSSNKIYSCFFCKKRFSSSQALGGHQNAHKQERDWTRMLREMEAYFPGLGGLNPYLNKPHLLLGGHSQDALSNENHLGITLDCTISRGSGIHPSSNSGVTRGIMGTNMTVVPRVIPTGFLNGNPGTNGSSSRGLVPLPSSRNTRPLIPKRVSPFSPRQTTNLSNNMISRKNVLREENFISKVGINNIVEIDDNDYNDDDQPEEGESKSWNIDLTLSL